MYNLRYFVRLISAFFSRFKGLLLIGAILGIVIFFFAKLLMPTVLGRQIERVGLTGRFTSSTLPDEILELISDGLTKINEQGIVEPNLAKAWETPDQGKTWIFYLNDNLYWQDGKKIKSQDINYQFSDVEIEKPDDKTLVFKLKDPFSPFPTVVSRPVFKKGLLGTGDWQVTKLKLSGEFIQELIIKNKKQKKEKRFKFYPTEERAKLAYKLGQVESLINVFDPSPLDTWKVAKLEKKINEQQVVTIFFNIEDKFLEEKTVRQALNYAIDKESFNGTRAISPLSPKSWAYNPQVKKYSYDPARAKKLLSNGVKEQKGVLAVKLVTTPILLPIAEKIANYWEAVGVKTILQVTSGVPTDYQAFLAVFDIPKDPDQYSFWHSTQETTNIANYKNPRIDKLLEDGRTEIDLEERRKIYLDFQRFLVEDSPAVFIYHPVSYDIYRK